MCGGWINLAFAETGELVKSKWISKDDARDKFLKVLKHKLLKRLKKYLNFFQKLHMNFSKINLKKLICEKT